MRKRAANIVDEFLCRFVKMGIISFILLSHCLLGEIQLPDVGTSDDGLFLDELGQFLLEELDLILVVPYHIFESSYFTHEGLLDFRLLLCFQLLDFAGFLVHI